MAYSFRGRIRFCFCLSIYFPPDLFLFIFFYLLGHLSGFFYLTSLPKDKRQIFSSAQNLERNLPEFAMAVNINSPLALLHFLPEFRRDPNGRPKKEESSAGEDLPRGPNLVSAKWRRLRRMAPKEIAYGGG